VAGKAAVIGFMAAVLVFAMIGWHGMIAGTRPCHMLGPREQGIRGTLDWYSTVFELIDMRSFSNLWFWIALAVVWSTASHWVLGVPFDMVSRARRKGGPAAEDLTDLLRINTTRLLYIADEAGLWVIASGTFFLTGFAVLGWVYWVEIAQALFLLGLPMSMVSLLSVYTARALHEKDHDLDAVYKRLGRHRLIVQGIGMVSIFITAMWGMYMNLSVGALGG
jgi:hypothetical protein